jgi:hypothetical protein
MERRPGLAPQVVTFEILVLRIRPQTHETCHQATEGDVDVKRLYPFFDQVLAVADDLVLDIVAGPLGTTVCSPGAGSRASWPPSR